MLALQVGCGNSELAKELHDEGFTKVWSIDTSPTVIKKMKEHHSAYPGLVYEEMDALNMNSYTNGFFDVLIDKATLEAIPYTKHDKYLGELARVLRRGGKYIVVTDLKVVNIPTIKAFTCIEIKEVAREDHAEGEQASVYVFVHDPEKKSTDVLSPLQRAAAEARVAAEARAAEEARAAAEARAAEERAAEETSSASTAAAAPAVATDPRI